ncbi:MAG TPA: carboxypeptidase-like regulatory domain-containing protein [Bryobacteraceae bacterium]
MKAQLRRLASHLLVLPAVALLATSLHAQSIYGTLTGIVSDPSGGVVADAKLQLQDQQSGSQRETTANGEGYYTFVSLPPGVYQLTVTSSGFEILKHTGISVLGGDKTNLNVTLKVGSTSNTVEVTGDVDELAPVDSGEKSNRLTTKELDNFVQLGTNAAEFIKIMPGFGISNGTSNKSNYNGQTVGINGNGGGGNQSPLNGAFSYNGLPSNSLDITADGAHVSDPGCNCATPVNPNSNMISEFKVTMSNFSAENQKGPGVISSVAKSGGRDFHGSGIFSARNAVLNANDWLSNYSRVARPDNAYYYPGFTLGGPVLLPKVNFNRKRNKLFFFTGFQYYYQVLDTGLIRATVPTAGMRNGDFSPAELAKLGATTTTGQAPQQINARGLASFPGGIIPKSAIDPNMQALMNLYQAPNADPYSNGGYNWVDDLKFNQNSWQSMSRVDYSISDSTKLYVRYNAQREVQLFPIGLWSSPTLNAQPYPTPIQGKNQSDSVTASLTHVFSSSMTNEAVFSYTFIGFPNVFQDPSKVDKAKIGYTYNGLYKNGVTQFPNINASGEVASIGTYGGFEVGGPSQGLYADKYMPNFSDTLAKVWGKHTLKAGFFWEHIRNAQPNNASVQGAMTFTNTNSNSLGSAYADMLIGNMNAYTETNFNRINDIGYTTTEGFIQDSWKVSKRLTLDLGIRITRFPPWTDNLGFGYSIFDPSKYSSSCTPVQYCGFVWNKRDSSVPVAGFPTRAAYYQPRFGVAYDLFGTGKTVLRGGWGRYYYHSGQFTTGLNVSAGTQQINLTNNLGLANTPWAGSATATPLLASELGSINVSSAALSIGAVDSKDDRDPVTDSYSFTISQRVPWSGLVEVAYVGNQSRDLLNTSGGAGSNINLVPVGSMLSSNNGGVDPATLNANNFRPLAGISDINLATNNLYANYNSLQITYMRSKGRSMISANYTFGKAMGIVSSTIDSLNLNNDYGVQSTNRPQIANVLYSYEVGRVSRNKFIGGFTNGWQLSGVVQMQSGPNLTGQRNQNFGLTLNSFKIPGTTFNVSNTSLLGTPNIQLSPILTCDPRQNLAPHQFINPNCFSFPTQVGQNGATTLPVIYGPAFFNADLGIFKNFAITEKQKLQFRIDGYNFLNHPLWSFNNANLTAGFDGTTGKLNTPLFGTVNTKQGARIVQLQVKYTF